MTVVTPHGPSVLEKKMFEITFLNLKVSVILCKLGCLVNKLLVLKQ